jgi:hypothetical protein
MEDLFSTNIAVNNQNINYRVIFEDEKYTFVSEADQSAFKTFSFRREHDAWVDQEALEKFLMKQH